MPAKLFTRFKPVTFHYKNRARYDATPQFGLIAEEVAEVNPDLVVRDEKAAIFIRPLRYGERDVT